MKGILSICGALAAGEYLASFFPSFAALWPVVVFALVLVALFGYGFAVRFWPLVFFFLLGVGLFLRASTDDVLLYREQPWLRGRELRARRSSVATSPVWVRPVRADLARRMSVGLEDDRAAVDLVRAIVLGERGRLRSDLKDVFVSSGTLHVFAISGLHVAVVAQVLLYLLALFLVPRRLIGLFSVPLLWSYVILIGCPPSAIRAALMASVLLLAPVCWRRPNGVRAWALAFLVVHLVSPRMIVNVGNILSFVVMLSIVLVGETVRDLAKWKQSLVLTFAAWAVGVPISAHVFGRVTPGGILANLVLIFAAKMTVVAGAVGILASTVSTTLAAHVNNLGALFVRLMVGLSTAVSKLPFSNFETGSWTISSCLLWYGVLLILTFMIVKVRNSRKPF